jgi:hypothetical protein
MFKVHISTRRLARIRNIVSPRSLTPGFEFDFMATQGRDGGDCDGRSGTRTDFCPCTSVFPCQYYPISSPDSHYIHLSLTLFTRITSVTDGIVK